MECKHTRLTIPGNHNTTDSNLWDITCLDCGRTFIGWNSLQHTKMNTDKKTMLADAANMAEDTATALRNMVRDYPYGLGDFDRVWEILSSIQGARALVWKALMSNDKGA